MITTKLGIAGCSIEHVIKQTIESLQFEKIIQLKGHQVCTSTKITVCGSQIWLFYFEKASAGICP